MTDRQAVVVIHGMGEQSPLGITRSLVDVVIEDRADGGPKYYSRPDKVSPANQYDLRRYLAPRLGPRLQTEFYEYHWAHLMSGNKLSDLVPLLKSLFLKVGPGKLGRLRPVWFALLTIMLLLATLIVIGVVVAGREVGSWDVPGIVAVIGVGGIWATVATWVMKWLTYGLTHWFVDAARYWNAAPRNQDVRNQIRAGLIDLLDALHDSGRYDRIIVAAHSLGSVIAYDALAYLWARYNKLHASGATVQHDALDRFEKAAAALNAAAADMSDDTEIDGLRMAYRAEQWRLWSEMRCNGFPWLVTDFVTFGSPLAHASVLIADGPEDLEDRVGRKEWPSSPPQPDSRPETFHWICEAGVRLLYHAALFAPVRWTNVWYDEDSFGGPIDPRLGLGIENHELTGDGGSSKWWLAAHASYLSHPRDSHPGGATASLRKAMDLSPAAMPRCQTISGKPPQADPDSAYHTSKRSLPRDPELTADATDGRNTNEREASK